MNISNRSPPRPATLSPSTAPRANVALKQPMAARVDGFQPAKLRPVSAAVIAPIDSRAAAGGTTGILIGMSKAVVGGKGGAKIIGEEG